MIQQSPEGLCVGEQLLPDGAVICYWRSGSGPPLILLHALGAQGGYFSKVAAALASRYTVYELELPGHGRSRLRVGNYDEPTMRAAVSQFIQQLGLEDVTLVGECIGAVLALTVATEVPRRIRRCVAVNPYDYGEEFGGGIRRSPAGRFVGFFRICRLQTVERHAILMAVRLRGSRVNGTQTTDRWLTGSARGRSSIFGHWRTWIRARELYSRVPGQVDLVYSASDWSWTCEREENRRVLQPRAFVNIDCAGHFASLENPEAIANVIMGSGPTKGAREMPEGARRLTKLLVVSKQSGAKMH